MSLEYRSGRYHVIYWPQGRRGGKKRLRVPVDIQDLATAQIFHDEVVATKKGFRAHAAEPVALTGLTIGKLWDEYLKWYELHRAPTTYRDIKNVGKWVKEYIGAYSAEDISLHHLEAYKRLRSATHRADHPIPRAVNKEVDYIKGFIKWAGRAGHITARRIIVDKLPYSRPVPQVLSVAEVMQILNAAEPFYRAYLACLYVLGLRTVEVRNMTWDKIDWQTGTIQMVQKGGSIKPLPVGPSLLSALKEIYDQRPPLPAGWPEKTPVPVFLNPRTGKAVRWIRPAIARACQKAKITRPVTPHLFRHSVATHMVDRGVNMRFIQDFLGHANITTTQHYVKVSMANLREAQKLIDIDLTGMGYRAPAKGAGGIHLVK